MTQRKKEEDVKKIAELLSRCTIAIATDYRGVSVADMSRLRRQIKESGGDYHVIKNTLACLASEKVGKEGLKGFLSGPTAIAFGYGEAVELAKVLVQYISSSQAPFIIRGGLLDGRVLNPEEVKSLSLLPPREILISQLTEKMQLPITSLVITLRANLWRLIRILELRRKQLEGG